MTINCRGTLLNLSNPIVMGILNLTPDSFFDGGHYNGEKSVLKQVEKMLHEGAAVIDIGGMSTKPGAEVITPDAELARIMPHLQNIIRHFPDAIISVDTVHAKVALQALQAGAHLINDISAGRLDTAMIPTVAKYKAPYVIMHMQGMPNNMQQNPTYNNVLTEVTDFLAERIAACMQAGITDIVLDPGFGFGKTVEHNYTLLRNLKYLAQLNLPLLAGVSRKSMICKVLGVNPDKALNGTTAVNTLALLNGANILRVHDVKEAVETIKIVAAYNGE
jgi:dihydropteroate synthase